jgi:hypothetical protein
MAATAADADRRARTSRIWVFSYITNVSHPLMGAHDYFDLK